jgi:hypothetical protein
MFIASHKNAWHHATEYLKEKCEVLTVHDVKACGGVGLWSFVLNFSTTWS